MKPTAEFNFKVNKPIICTAIHAGSQLSEICRDNLNISDEIKYREEDPFTDVLARSFPNNIIAKYSRFEFDINRKRESSFYLNPEDAWGLEVRKNDPDMNQINSSYEKYDDFYEQLFLYFQKIKKKFDKIFVFDIHSFNHRRKGQNAEPDDQLLNPDIVLGTSNIPEKWYELVDVLQNNFAGFKLNNEPLDVRKNIRFPGGWFPRWLHYTFPGSVCCLSIEFKKEYMDEWSGELFPEKLLNLKEILMSSFPIINDYLKNSPI